MRKNDWNNKKLGRLRGILNDTSYFFIAPEHMCVYFVGIWK